MNKIIEKFHGKKVAGALVVFAMSIAGMAVLSRIGDSFMMPHAKVGSIKEMSLAYPVEMPGKIVARSEKPVYGPRIEGIKVGEVLVNINQMVTKGDELFNIDLDDLEVKIQDASQEMEKLTFQFENLEKSYENQVNERNRKISRAKEDYDDAKNASDHGIDVAYENMENARITLENHINHPPNEELQGEENEESGKDSGDENQTMVDVKAAWEQTKAELEQNYVQMQQVYDEAVYAGNESLKTASRQVEDASAEIPKDGTFDSLSIDLEYMKKSMEELESLKDAGGKVYAEGDGRVSKINISVGSVLGGEPAMLMEDSQQAFRFEGVFDAQLSTLVTEGQQCEIEIGGKVLENQRITTISQGEDGIYQASADLELGVADRSCEAILSFTKTSKSYKDCIPLSALFQGSDGAYILAVEESVTVLGVQTTAEKIPVTLLEENGEYAAVEGDFTGYSEIIVYANKTIKDGDRIRVVEE